MMNTDQIFTAAPAVYADSPVAEVTERYTFIPTTRLLADFEKLGWGVERARQQRSRVDKYHTKHLVVLRNTAFPAVNGNHPELIMVNSHDRTAAFRFMLGLFRFVCENGLVIADKMFESIRVRHIGYEFEDLEALTQGVVERMPKIIGAITGLSTITLTEDQQVQFAIKAIAARFTEYTNDKGVINEKAILKAVDVKDFLSPLRTEDVGDDVWRVYNRIQERLTKGGFKRIGTKDSRAKSVRSITNIGLDVSLNQTLWQMANEYAAR